MLCCKLLFLLLPSKLIPSLLVIDYFSYFYTWFEIYLIVPWLCIIDKFLPSVSLFLSKLALFVDVISNPIFYPNEKISTFLRT